MPLHNKKPLEKIPPPANLKPDDAVYFLEASGEIFDNYDAFFDRMILLNSTDFSCSLTGRTGLTYFEAVDSERDAREELMNFPDFLESPLLFLVQRYTCRGRLDDVLSDVMGFMRDRYFIGEELQYQDGRRKRMARVEAVRLVGDARPAPKAESSGKRSLGGTAEIGLPAADAYRYDVQIMEEEEEENEDDEMINGRDRRIGGNSEDDGRRTDCRMTDLSRKRLALSKQKLRLFLKNSCVLVDKRQEVKEDLQRDCLLDHQTWTSFYSGPEPSFPQTPLTCRGRPSKTPKAEKTPSATSDEPKKKGRRKSTASSDQKQQSASPKKQMSEKKRNQIAAQQDELASQFETARRLGVEGLDKFEQDERVLTAKDLDALKELIKQARIKDREEAKEKRRREKEAAAEWKKPRDDLLCDDLKPLPTYAPLPVASWMANDDLAAYLSLYHFFLSFQELLPIKEIRGTARLSFSDIVIAVRCRDPRNSSLADIVRILWQARMERAEDEDGDEANLSRPEEIGLQAPDLENLTHADNIRQRNELHEAFREAHGQSVRHLPMDWLTMSEVIRLHLLTSGYFTGVSTFRHRTYQRGGPRCYEDAAYQFAERHPDVLQKLETGTVFDLTAAHRLELLQMLVDQLLGYFKFRNYHDERIAELVEAKRQLRQLRVWGAGQEKEARDAQLAREFENEQIEKLGDEGRMERPKASKETTKLRAHLKALRERRRTNLEELHEMVLAGIAYAELEMDEIVEAREVQLEQYRAMEDECMQTICGLESISCLVHLGKDRAYRSYFLLESVPVVLVEEPSEWERERAGPCEEATPVADVSVLGNAASARLALLGCTADEYCPVHGSLARDRKRFAYVDEPAKVEQMVAACNARGLREAELGEEMAFRQAKMAEVVERTARKVESGQLASFFMADAPDPGEVESTMDWTTELRELLADLEEKMFMGQVGSLPAGIDRTEWRRRLLEEGDVTGLVEDDVCIRVEGQLKKEEEEGDVEKEVLIYREDFPELNEAQRLGLALLQLFQGIQFKYFKDPFVVDGRNGEKKISEVFLCWQRNVAQTARSIPAVSLSLFTLEPNILWSKSRLQGKCRACRRKGETANLVLCVECDNTYHLTCVRPTLTEALPDWLCAECNAVRKRQEAKAKRQAAKDAEQARKLKEEEERGGDEEEEEGNFTASESPEARKDTVAEEEMRNAVKTSSGRVVKRVLYNENILSPAVPKQRSSRREGRRDRENGWSDYGDGDYDSAASDEGYGRAKKRRHDDTQRVSIGLRENCGLKERFGECERAIKETMSMECAWPFTKPVDGKEVPDYYTVIEHPMDLQTMVQKIKNNIYDTLEEVQADLDLMISNCKLYNQDGSDIVDMAIRTSEFLQPRLERIMRGKSRR